MDVIDGMQFLRFAAALVFVLALMGGLAIVMKRINGGAGMTPASKRRLKIVEILPLDAKRKLAIIKRDDVEHLVILGATTETVIESGIESQHTSNDKNTEVTT